MTSPPPGGMSDNSAGQGETPAPPVSVRGRFAQPDQIPPGVPPGLYAKEKGHRGRCPQQRRPDASERKVLYLGVVERDGKSGSIPGNDG